MTQTEQRFGRIPSQPFGGPAQRAAVSTAVLPVAAPAARAQAFAALAEAAGAAQPQPVG